MARRGRKAPAAAPVTASASSAGVSSVAPARNAVDARDVGAMLRAARKRAALTMEALACAAGCSKAYLSLVESGRRTLSIEKARALEAALGIDDGRLQAALNWQHVPQAIREDIERSRTRSQAMSQRLHAALQSRDPLAALRHIVEIDGEDNWRDAGDGGSISSAQHPPHALQSLPLASLPRIPIINKVAAGYPREFTDMDYPAPPRGAISDESLACPDVTDPDAFAARVVGDSMEPDYREGDVVVFSPLMKIDPAGGIDCFVRLERDVETTFKRVYFEKGGRRIRLQPLNSAYPPTIVEREAVSGLWPAVYVLRKVRAARS